MRSWFTWFQGRPWLGGWFWVKSALLVAGLGPLGAAVVDIASGQAVDPVERATHTTGNWGLIFLCLTLAMSPLRHITGRAEWIRCRRMLGLFAFFYIVLHFMVYVALDQGGDVRHIAHDVVRRPFITVGFVALVMLVPLALTSTKGWIRRLKRGWTKLHRLVYPIAVLGVVHYWWLVKRDHRQPVVYAMVVAVLLGWRVAVWGWRRWRSESRQSPHEKPHENATSRLR